MIALYKAQTNKGFTLLELIAVLVLVGILAGTVSARLLPSDTFQLQSSRDQVVTAFFAAQQRAMAQTNSVRLSLVSPNQIDIREDTDGDGDFNDESSLRLGGTGYPVTLLSHQTISAAIFDFDRLGKTSASTLTLSQGSDSVNISVTATGYIF